MNSAARGYMKLPYGTARQMLRGKPLCKACSNEYCLTAASKLVDKSCCESCRAVLGFVAVAPVSPIKPALEAGFATFSI